MTTNPVFCYGAGPVFCTGPFCLCGAPGRWCSYCNGVTCDKHHAAWVNHSIDMPYGVREHGFGGITWPNGKEY